MQFQFRAHLHLGISPDDSIQLPYGVAVPEQFPKPVPTPQLLNLDFFDTPWDDKDTKWFRLDGPEVDLGSPLEVTILVEQTLGDAPYGVRLIRLLATGWVELDRAGPGLRGYELKTKINKGERYFVCIFRDDLPALRELEFIVTAKANVSLLRGGAGGKPRLICEDETSGWARMISSSILRWTANRIATSITTKSAIWSKTRSAISINGFPIFCHIEAGSVSE